VIDLRTGEIRNIPGWQALVTRALSSTPLHAQDLAKLPFANDEQPLKSLICEHLFATYRWQSDERQIALTYGASEALEVVFSCAIPKGGSIGMCVPSFPFWRIVQKVDRRVCPLPSNLTEIVSAVRQRAIHALLLVQPHNPSGRLWCQEELVTIEQAARDSGCALILDIVGAARPGWGEIDPALWWIVDSFSKQFALPGLRLGYLRQPDRSLIGFMRHGLGVGISASISNIGQALMSERLALRQAIDEELEARREDARVTLARFDIQVPADGIFMCVDTLALGSSRCAPELARLLAELGVAVTTDEFLLPDEAGPTFRDRFVRISIGCEDRGRLTQGLTSLASTLDRLRCVDS
jgi:histidinol-phosphate/aromatic aminotransferase/cobyric acid decarboxylase-like protein